ncbi:MAG: bacteriohemerythrin, partial [Salinivirgaceae bacterium]|nr:bacteriohemerythrin [Salinivirgaceae bacterium]
QDVEKELNRNMDIVRTLAQTNSAFYMLPENQWKPLFIQMYRNVYEENPQFYKLWDSWELRFIDSTYKKDHGRFVITYFKEKNAIKYHTIHRSMDVDPPLYAKIKREATESIWEPYWDVFADDVTEKKFMTSMSVPLLFKGEYMGIVAIDITMDKIQEIVGKIKPFEGSYAFLLSNQSTFVSHPSLEIVGKSISEYVPELDLEYKLTERIKNGETIEIATKDPETNQETFVVFYQVQIGRTKTPWSIGITIPTKVILADANRSFMISMIVALLGLIILTIVIVRIARSISQPMQHTTAMLKKMALGDIDSVEKLELLREDEIGQMSESLNRLIEGLDRTAHFAREIGNGNLNQEFHLLSDDDVLGNALIDMRQSLKHAEQEEDKRKIEDEKQRWTTEGIAKFGEILRNYNNDLKDLSFHLMSNLVNYLKANQGALFVVNDDDEQGNIYLEMTSAIAYNKEKYVKKRVKIGEDLVGRAAHEKLTIFMTDIPEDYIEITSGMGTANPRCLVIVPVLLNEQVYGVIELASFNVLEQYQIEFIEKIGQSVASTISSVRINEKTQKLLRQSQQQREELSAQEEEMRQNLEELQATQEESARKEFEMRGLIKALSASTYTIEYDLNGRIIAVNDAVAQLFGLSKDQIVGTYHKDGSDFRKLEPEAYESFWNDLRNGIPRKEISHLMYNGREIFLSETYTPIFDDDEKPYKVLKIGFDITDLKKKNTEVNSANSEIEALQKQVEKQNAELESLRNSLKSTQNNPQAPEKQEITLDLIVPKGENLIDGSPDLLTSINEIDEQHDRIIMLTNQLYEAFVQEKSKKEIKELLKNLADFTAYHFSNEERYFKQFGYENAIYHIQEHRLFIDKINDFRKAYQTGKNFDTAEIMVFMKQWIENHFGETDQDFIQLFIENGL